MDERETRLECAKLVWADADKTQAPLNDWTKTQRWDLMENLHDWVMVGRKIHDKRPRKTPASFDTTSVR